MLHLFKISLSSKDKLTFSGKEEFGVFKCNTSVFIILFFSLFVAYAINDFILNLEQNCSRD